jgi:hypothetical protein
VGYPKVDAKPYERRDGIVFDKTQLVTVIHYGCYKILEFISTNLRPITLIFEAVVAHQ